MRLLVAMLGTAGLASVMLTLAILARLTKRWEAVTRTRSYYRWFYVAAALVGLASLTRLVRIGHLPSDGFYPRAAGIALPLWGQDLTGTVLPSAGRQAAAGLAPFLESSSWFYLVLYHLPLMSAMTISLILAWRNWRWLLWTQ